MTTLYKPVLIETAEQAEALPDGTVLIREDHFAFQKHAGRFVSADPHDLPVAHAWEVVGWTALVPLEAEEQHITAKLLEDPPHSGEMCAFLAGETPPDMTRYVTPWEGA